MLKRASTVIAASVVGQALLWATYVLPKLTGAIPLNTIFGDSPLVTAIGFYGPYLLWTSVGLVASIVVFAYANAAHHPKPAEDRHIKLADH